MVATDNLFTNTMDEMDNRDSSDHEEEDDDEAVSSSDEDDDDSMLPHHQAILEDDDSCPICLNEFGDQQIGVPDTCSHAFCVDCILEWSKNSNSCPVDRIVFGSVSVYRRFSGRFLHKVAIAVKETIIEEEEDLTFCQVCGSADNEDTLLLCDGCDQGYHCACLTPSLDVVPHGEWFCRVCQPDLAESLTSPSPVERGGHGVGRTRATERVRAQISEARLRHSRFGGLEQRIDSIVDEILIRAGRRFQVVEQTPSTLRSRPTSRTTRKKKSRSKSRRKTTSKRRRSKKRGKRGTKSKCTKASASRKESKGSSKTTAAAAAFRRPLSMFGGEAELDEYLARDNAETPSYLIAQKHRQLAQSALRFNAPLPSMLTLGDRLAAVGRPLSPNPEPVPDLLGSILSGQEVLMTPSDNISIHRGGVLHVNKPTSSRALPKFTVSKEGLPDDGSKDGHNGKGPDVHENRRWGRKAAVSPDKDNSGKAMTTQSTSGGGSNSSSHRQQGTSNGATGGATDGARGESHNNSRAEGAAADSSLGNGGDEFFDDPDMRKNAKKRNPLKRFNLMKQEADDDVPTNARGAFKRKIQIKKIFNLPTNTNELSDAGKPEEPREPEVYDPFEPTEDDDDQVADVDDASQDKEEEDIYDPFQPTASDEESVQDEDDPKEDDSPPVFSKFVPPSSPPEAMIANLIKEETETEIKLEKSPLPELSPEENDEKPADISLAREHNVNKSPAAEESSFLTDFEVDELLDSNLDAATVVPQEEEPADRLSPEIDMFAESELLLEAEDTASGHTPDQGPRDPSSAWREKIRSLSSTQETDDVVKLPGFQPGMGARGPVLFKKLKKAKSADEIGKAFSDTKTKAGPLPVAGKIEKVEESVSSPHDLAPTETVEKTEKDTLQSEGDDVTEKSKEKKQRKKKRHKRSDSVEEEHPSPPQSLPKERERSEEKERKEKVRSRSRSVRKREKSQSPSRSNRRSRSRHREKGYRDTSGRKYRHRSRSASRGRRSEKKSKDIKASKSPRSGSRKTSEDRRRGRKSRSASRQMSTERRTRHKSRSKSRNRSPRRRSGHYTQKTSKAEPERRSPERRRKTSHSRSKKSSPVHEKKKSRSRSRHRSPTKSEKKSRRHNNAERPRKEGSANHETVEEIAPMGDVPQDVSSILYSTNLEPEVAETPRTKKHKKKKRQLEEGEIPQDDVIVSEEEIVPELPKSTKKKKKKDRHKHSDEAYDEVLKERDTYATPEVAFVETFSQDEMPKRHKHVEKTEKHHKGRHSEYFKAEDVKVIRVVDNDVADFLGLMMNDRKTSPRDDDRSALKESKKKKKKKRSHDIAEASDVEHTEEIRSPPSSSSKRKKRRQDPEHMLFEVKQPSAEKKKPRKKSRHTETRDLSPSELPEWDEEVTPSSHKPKKRKMRKSSEHIEEDVQSPKKCRKKKKHKEKDAEDEDDLENRVFEVVSTPKSKKKKKKSHKRQPSQEISPCEKMNEAASRLKVEEEVFVYSNEESMENVPECVSGGDRKVENPAEHWQVQDEVSSVDVDAELEDALVTRTTQGKMDLSDEEIPEIRHADLTRMLSSHEMDEDQRYLISPIHTPQPPPQKSKTDDMFHSEPTTPHKPDSLPPDQESQDNGNEMYSPTAALLDLSPSDKDLRSPSPLSPSSLSPERAPIPLETSSQEITVTLAEEFLEQSRKRWNERKRAPGLNTSFSGSTRSSNEIPGLGLQEGRTKHDVNLSPAHSQEYAMPVEPNTMQTDTTTDAPVAGPVPSLDLRKDIFASPSFSTPVQEDIFADSPFGVAHSQQEKLKSTEVLHDTDARDPKWQADVWKTGSLETPQKNSTETSFTSQITPLDVREDQRSEAVEDVVAVEGNPNASSLLIKEKEIAIEDPANRKPNKLPEAGATELKNDKSRSKTKHESRSYSSERRRSRRDSRSPKRDSRTKKSDEERPRDRRRTQDDRSRRRRSRSPRQSDDTRRRSKRSPRRRSRSKSPKRERDSHNRTSSPRPRRHSKSPHNKSRRSRSRSASKNKRKNDKPQHSPSHPPAQHAHASSVSAFRSTAESVVFSAKKKDHTNETTDTSPQPIATISGLSISENAHTGIQRDIMQDHHHDLGDDEFIAQGLMKRSNQSSALRTLIEVPTRPVAPSSQSRQAKVPVASASQMPADTKPTIKLSSRTLANEAAVSPVVTIIPTIENATKQTDVLSGGRAEMTSPKRTREKKDMPTTPPPPPPPPLAFSRPRTPQTKTEIPGLSYINESGTGEKDPDVYSPSDALTDEVIGTEVAKSKASAAKVETAEEGKSVLNPTEILNFIGLNPQQKSAAQNAIMSIAELSKHLQLGQITKSEKTGRGGRKDDDGLSPVSIDNIESSAVEMYNKGRESGLLKKLQFQERVVEEAKQAIKPYYERREISKLEYKEIMKRAVNKICMSGTIEVNNVKIRRLIRRYIEKYQQKNALKKEKMRSKLDGKLERTVGSKPHSPSPPPYQPLTPPQGSEKPDVEGHKVPLDTPSLLKREPRKIVTLPDLPLPPPPPPPRPRHMP